MTVLQAARYDEILKKRVSTTKLNIPSARLYIKQYSPNEFNSIINLAEDCHIKMMEENYNAGWKDNQ